MPRISVIIVNYNGADYIVDCLRALAVQLVRDFEVIAVDNGSSDNSLELVRIFSEKNSMMYPIKIIPLDRNIGFAGGNLEGLSHATADFIALLNNDAEPDKAWLGNLLAAMEADSSIGICASKMMSSGTDKIDSAGDGFSTALRGFKRGEGKDRNIFDRQEYVFGACAGAALYRRKMIEEIGFFDEDFFLIHEDTDLNLRAQLAGWKVLYVPSAVVNHKVRSSIGHMSDIAVYYTVRNSEFVRIKNVTLALFLRCLPGFIIGAVSEFIYFALKHGRLRIYLRAKRDAIKKMRGMLNKRGGIMSMRKVDDRYLYGMMTPVLEREFLSEKIRKFLFG